MTTAQLEAEFAALEVVLSHAKDGELCFPDSERDLADCARAAARLGWLGNDGAPEPTRVDELDSYLLGAGGWLDPDVADPEAHVLAATIAAAEAELRAEQWSALETVLAAIEGRRVKLPAAGAERVTLSRALHCLHWHPSPWHLAPDEWHPDAPKGPTN